MAQVINTNTLSLMTQNNLNKSQSSLNTAIQRLSSGLRINSAKDDAAGQAIANRFTSNINGLTTASRNANDGISLAQTTEGALTEVNNNLQRIRDLSVQAANGTNSDSDLNSIQAEITQRLDEISRVSDQTQFNGVKVLASDQTLKIQVGAKDGETISIDLKEINAQTLGLSAFDVTKTVASSAISTVASTNLGSKAIAAAATTTLTSATGGVTHTLSFNDTASAASWAVYVDQANPDQLYVSNDSGSTFHAATYNASTNALEFDGSAAGTVAAPSAAAVTAGQQVVVDSSAGTSMDVDDITGRTDSNASASPTAYVDGTGQYYVSTDGGSTYATATITATTGALSYDSSTASTIAAATSSALTQVFDMSTAASAVTVDLSAVSSTVTGASLHAYSDGSGYVVQGTNAAGASVTYKAIVDASTGGVTLGDAQTADLSGLSTQVTGASLHKLNDGSGYVVEGSDANGNAVTYRANIATATGAVTLGDALTTDPLAAVDKALSTVDSFRSDLGAIQNRFDSSISNLDNTVTNLSAARSRIQDADYATEVSNMTRAQILQQAGTSVLAQANQTTQGVLSLLR
jgi:flagellin